jgi:hypothetical protein
MFAATNTKPLDVNNYHWSWLETLQEYSIIILHSEVVSDVCIKDCYFYCKVGEFKMHRTKGEEEQANVSSTRYFYIDFVMLMILWVE